MKNKRANFGEKLEQFRRIKKEVQDDYPRIAQGKQNLDRLLEVRRLVDEVRAVLQKVDLRNIPDAGGRQIPCPRVESVIRDFAVHLVNVEEATVNRPEASPAYAELRNRLARPSSPETDVIDNCDILAVLLQALLDIQINVEARRAGSLLDENLDHHVEAAAWKAGLTGSNATELAAIRLADRPNTRGRKQSTEGRAVRRRRDDVLDKLAEHRDEFRNAVTDTLNGALRTVPHDSAEAARFRTALEDLANLPPEEETALIKAWIVATEVTGTENGFHDIEDLIARLRRAASQGKP